MIADGNHDSDVEHQSGDFRTQERLKPLANVQSNIVATDEQDPVVGIGEDHSVIELLVTSCCSRLRMKFPVKIESIDRQPWGQCVFHADVKAMESTDARE